MGSRLEEGRRGEGERGGEGREGGEGNGREWDERGGESWCISEPETLW